jgi:glutathione synthase/RimK-type ligase-like ATP-grasp enzyme
MALSTRLLVLEAGSAGANNLIHSLRCGDPSLVIVGCNDSRFVLKKSAADRNYVLPPFAQGYRNALRRIIKTEHINLVIPTSDTDVLRISALRDKLGCQVFLPGKAVIERCQDKYALSVFLRRRRIPAPLTYPIKNADNIEALFRRFEPRTRLWCRIRAGAGSYGAIPVTNPDQAQSWIAYWERMRAVPRGSFTLSEYLPGRDFCVQCLWKKGTLVLAKMAERITYLDTGSPSGVSSMPALAKTVFEPHVFDVCEKAIRALDPVASGVFFIDIKESDDGQPCITEINAGRFATMTNIHDLAGRHNMAVTYVRLALGKRVKLREVSDFAEGYYLVRSVDTLPAVIRNDDLYEGIRNA